jgi:hypothetical protein
LSGFNGSVPGADFFPVFAVFADCPETFEFGGVLEELAGNAGFVAAKFFEGVGVFDPGPALGGDCFEGVVMLRGGFVLGEGEIENVAVEGGDAVEAGVAVDQFLDELALEFGFGLEVSVERIGESLVGLVFVGLEQDAIAGEAVFEGVHACPLFAGFGFGTGGFFCVVAVDEIAKFFFHGISSGQSVAVGGGAEAFQKCHVVEGIEKKMVRGCVTGFFIEL